MYESENIIISKHSIVGTRDYQEDAAGYEAKDSGCLAVLCDGMGGLNGGETASNLALEELLSRYRNINGIENYPEFFYASAVDIDKAVYNLMDSTGERLKAGTTMISIAIDKGKLYWLSVGDSRIYIIRNGQINVANEEHNYQTKLDSMLKTGQITNQQYEAEKSRGAALTSYIGIGDVYLMDISDEPICLQDGDIIILSSDGMYRRVSDDMILDILYKWGDNLDEAAKALTDRAMELATGSQDNTTVEIIKYRENVR
jgi:serine/threonine protein phosphatase PrpC